MNKNLDDICSTCGEEDGAGHICLICLECGAYGAHWSPMNVLRSSCKKCYDSTWKTINPCKPDCRQCRLENENSAGKSLAE